MASTMPTVRLSQPSQPHPHSFPLHQPTYQGYDPAQQQQHLLPSSDYEHGVQTGREIRRTEPQLTAQQLQQYSIQQQQQQQQQQQRPQQQHPRQRSTSAVQQPPLPAQVQHHPGHLQHPQAPYPHSQQQPGYPLGTPHLPQQIHQQQQQQLQSSPHLLPHHTPQQPSHFAIPPGSQPQQQPPRPRHPPTLQVQTALGSTGVPVAPPFLSPAPGPGGPASFQHQQQQRQLQQQQYQAQMQHQQQQLQQPIASTSFLPAESGTQVGGQGGGPSSATMLSRDQQSRSSSQGADSRGSSSKGRGEKEEEEQYFVELIYEFLFKSGLHSTARALLSETSSSSSNVLSPSARDSSLTASPSSIPGGSPLPSTSTSNNTAATNPNGSRTKSISSHLSSNPDPSSGNNDALSDSPHAVDEAMNSPSNRKTEDVDATGGVGTLPSPESGTGGSVGGVKEDGGSEKAETTRTNTTLSDGGTSRRKEASEAIKLRDPAVEGATGPKGQLLEWWTIFQDVSKVHSTLSKSVPSSDSEVYLSSVIAGQSLPSSNSTALVGPSNISGQALPPPPGSYVGGPPQHQQQRIIAGMGGQQQQQQMQPGQQQRKVMMAGAHGVPVSQQWLSRDGPEGHPVPMSLQQQQQLAHKNAQMQQQQQQQQNMRPPPAQGPNGQLQHQRMQQQQPMSQFAGHPGMDPQQQAQFAQQQQQSQAQLQHQQQQQQHHHQQLEAARVRNQQAHRALQNQVHETAQLLKYPREAIESYVNYPPNELQIVADQLQEALRRANMERRPLAEGDEPSPKRTRVEGPPRVSMQQQQQQAMRQVTGGQQGGRIPSGQMHPNGQQQHHPQQQQSPFPPVDFNPQVPGGPQPQTKAQSAQGYAQFMHRRASEQQAQAQAAGSPYNGSMPPPATPATPAFAGSPSAPQQQYDNGAPRPASQASHHGQAYPGSNQMSRSGSGSEQYSNGTTPGPSSTPRIVQGTLPAGELVGNGAPVAASGGKGKGKPAPKKPRVKKVTKAAAAAEPPSPAPRPESSMSHHSPYPPAPQSVPQQQPSPFPPQQPTPPPPPPPPAQQQVVQQQQQPEELVDHHQQQINPSEFDIGNLGGDVNGFDGSFNMDGLELDQYMSYDTSGVGSNGGEEQFDFSSWMVEETN